ncbi:MAG: hypothetical protein COU25_03425 [Candidatus Levybacteria bacterium CG10_big_fil_rev_8_21_14_0_10_35_13]|nr:MAG: hypothetical protein COU25_03425 [Candidatus Levybacteria bacterium CG10_big_fil_rev_8_21_14_0_10_35_13]
MPAFNLEHEQRRLSEPGITFSAKVKSAKDNLRTLVAERTYAPSFFELTATAQEVTSVGYEHRGDLDNSYAKSVEEAPTEVIVKRYDLENQGYREVRKQFFELPLNSTIMLFSPPPDEQIPDYPGHSFAYFYHILPGESQDERTIKALAWVNGFSKADQAEILNKFGTGEKVLPTEESILTSPVSVSADNGTQSFRTIWESLRGYFKDKGYSGFICPSSAVMQEYLLYGEAVMKNQHFELDVMIESLAQRLAAGATRDEIADDFDTMLGTADKDLLYKDWGYQESLHMNIPRHTEHTELDRNQAFIIFQQNRHLGKDVRQVMTFCGMSGGMKISNPFETTQPNQDAVVNSWTFTVKNDSEQTSQEQTKLCCTCPFCEKEVEAQIGGGRIKCPECKKSAPYSKAA